MMPHRAQNPAGRPNRKKRPLWPFFASALLNLLLALFFFKVILPVFERARTPAPSPLALQWTEFRPEEHPPTNDNPQNRQIVSNQFANDLEPDQARYLGERSARVEKETVGVRGMPAPGEGTSIPADSAMPKMGETKPADGRMEANGRRIFPTQEEIARLFAERRQEMADATAREPRAEGSGGKEALPLPLGDTMDLLDPSLSEGPFSMLNKKSFRYAGFITRVFERVYAHYLRRLYSSSTFAFLAVGESGEVAIETILKKNGEALTTRIIEFNGSSTLAEVGRAAMEQGAWDLNPPKGIESEDGLIHLVLLAHVRFAGLGNVYTPRYQGYLQFGVL